LFNFFLKDNNSAENQLKKIVLPTHVGLIPGSKPLILKSRMKLVRKILRASPIKKKGGNGMKVRVYLACNRKGKYWATTTHPQSCYNLPVIIDKGKNVIGPRHSIETEQGNIPIGKVTVGDQDGMGNSLEPENQATWKVRLKWAGYDA